MCGNYSCHFGHAAIVQFDLVFIAYLVQAVKDFEEFTRAIRSMKRLCKEVDISVDCSTSSYPAPIKGNPESGT